MPAVSVVMPVYNGARFLDRALTSLRAQTFADWELLAVDDASADDSAARLSSAAATDPRVRVFRHAVNGGQSAARNTALAAARGELVAYLDQDDEFYSDHLARAWSLRGAGDVLVFRYDLVEERPGHPDHGAVVLYDPALRARALFDETIAVPLGVVHRRTLLARVGGFDEALGRYRGEDEDGDLWRRFARSGARFAYVPAASGRYHVRADSVARTRPPAPAPAARVVTVEVSAAGGRYPLWVPADDVAAVHSVFEGPPYGGLDPTWLRTPPVVLDAGGGAGAFALYAKLAYHPSAVVHCFEPRPTVVALLRANVGRLSGVTVHPLALGRVSANASAGGMGPDIARVWDELGACEVDVLRLDARGADVLAVLGPRLARVRVVIIEGRPNDRPRIAPLLAGHAPVAAPAPFSHEDVVRFVRVNLLSSTTPRA